MKDVLLHSIDYAVKCHQGTNHFYDKVHPYKVHLQAVYNTALKFKHLIPNEHLDDVLSACWLHDTIEDTRQTYNDVKEQTNEHIAEIVYALTNEKGKTRSERANEKYYAGIRANKCAIFVKLCDRISNMEYSKQKGSGMFKKYVDELDGFLSNVGAFCSHANYTEMAQHLMSLNFDTFKESDYINKY